MGKKTFKGNTDTKVKVTKKEEKFLAIILKQNKSASLKWVSFTINEFTVDGNTYFTLPEGMYLGKKKLLLAMYLEGVSLPIGHKDIRWKTVTKTITNEETGEEETIEIQEMDGLKFDSEIINVLLGRGLASEFTNVKSDKTIFIIVVMIVINILLTIGNIGVNFI